MKKDLKRAKWNRKLAEEQWNWNFNACAQLSVLSRCSCCVRWHSKVGPLPKYKKDADDIDENDALGTCTNQPQQQQVKANNNERQKKKKKNNLIVLYKKRLAYTQLAHRTLVSRITLSKSNT